MCSRELSGEQRRAFWVGRSRDGKARDNTAGSEESVIGFNWGTGEVFRGFLLGPPEDQGEILHISPSETLTLGSRLSGPDHGLLLRVILDDLHGV